MFSNSTKRGLEVIELGCGCGLVGLALTVWKENCRVILTDLPEAESIANFNLSKNRGAKSSTAEFKVLRWGEPIPDYLKRIPRDLVLVTDCTYNPSSAPALVATLKTLANESPHLLIVVAMKIRHPSEAVFFDLMEAASLIQIDHCVNPLPNAEENEYSKGEGIEIYCFRLG
jgi:predicted nicotinamide N-methyase